MDKGLPMGEKNVYISSISLDRSTHTERYYCPSGENLNFSEEEVKNVERLRWNTFEQF